MKFDDRKSLKQMRKSCKVSQRRLAAASGIPWDSLNSFESGRRSLSPKALAYLWGSLGTLSDELREQAFQLAIDAITEHKRGTRVLDLIGELGGAIQNLDAHFAWRQEDEVIADALARKQPDVQWKELRSWFHPYEPIDPSELTAGVIHAIKKHWKERIASHGTNFPGSGIRIEQPDFPGEVFKVQRRPLDEIAADIEKLHERVMREKKKKGAKQ